MFFNLNVLLNFPSKTLLTILLQNIEFKKLLNFFQILNIFWRVVTVI